MATTCGTKQTSNIHKLIFCLYVDCHSSISTLMVCQVECLQFLRLLCISAQLLNGGRGCRSVCCYAYVCVCMHVLPLTLLQSPITFVAIVVTTTSYHNRHHPHTLRSPQPPPGRPRMEQLNNRIRSTRRMCFREQIPWNVADSGSNGDECEDGHLVPARFHIFFLFSNLLFWRALMFVAFGRCRQARFCSAGHFNS